MHESEDGQVARVHRSLLAPPVHVALSLVGTVAPLPVQHEPPPVLPDDVVVMAIPAPIPPPPAATVVVAALFPAGAGVAAAVVVDCADTVEIKKMKTEKTCTIPIHQTNVMQRNVLEALLNMRRG